MIRSFLVVSFVVCATSVQGQIVTVIAPDRQEIKINIPAGKYMEILGYTRGSSRAEGAYLEIENGRASVFDRDSYAVTVRLIAGPNTLLLKSGLVNGSRLVPSVLTYRLIDNTASSTRQQASPKADDIKLTDEFLMLDYTVQANTTYKLGISKDLKSWDPLFEFTPQSEKLNIELPKIILGNESYLKLE